jgi:hypothetical protein
MPSALTYGRSGATVNGHPAGKHRPQRQPRDAEERHQHQCDVDDQGRADDHGQGEEGREEFHQQSLLRSNNDRLVDLLQKLVTRLEGIENQLSQAQGGWRTLMWLGGASAGLGGLIAGALTHFFGRGTP